jgi:hypothetical protein
MSLYSIGLFVALGLIAVIWFAYVAPSERRYYDKKLQLLQERIEKRQRFAAEEKSAGQGNSTDSSNDGDEE